MKKTINILYLNFWEGFNPEEFKLTKILSEITNVNIIDPTKTLITIPDLLIYSCFTKDNVNNYNCPKLYFSGENDCPDFNVCDYAISSANLEFGHRHLHVPYFMFHNDYYNRLRIVDEDYSPQLFYDNREFCSCVVGNVLQTDPMRLQIIDKVAEVGNVYYGGSYRNNVGGRVADKIDFIKKFRFNIATENSKVSGYVTEKITDAFKARTVPIYWGSDDVSKKFSPDSFINVSDYDNLDSFAKDLQNINNDKTRYMKMMNAAPLTLSNNVDYDKRLKEFLTYIVENLHIRYTTDFGRVGIMKKTNDVIFNALFRRPVHL